MPLKRASLHDYFTPPPPPPKRLKAAVEEDGDTATPPSDSPPFDVALCFSPPTVTGHAIRKGTLDLLFFKSFLTAPHRRLLYDHLLAALPWYRVTYTVRGTTVNTPRWTTVFGIDDDAPKPLHAYQRRPRLIPPVLECLKDEVSQRLQSHFNFVLVNYYQDGNDSISFHSDDEDFLGPDPTIASLTLGSSRDFLMRPKPSLSKGKKMAKSEKWCLDSGDMVVMKTTTQSTWEHSIPKRANAKGRINITFRKAINAKGTDNYYRYNVGDGNMYRFVDGEMIEQVERK